MLPGEHHLRARVGLSCVSWGGEPGREPGRGGDPVASSQAGSGSPALQADEPLQSLQKSSLDA